MTQGQGPTTLDKERAFGSAISIGLRLASVPSIARFEYVHVDLHSGSGYNLERDCDGSPVVFFRLANDMRPNYRAFFCDKDADAISGLQSRLPANDKRLSFHLCDNAKVLDLVEGYLYRTQRKPHLAVGSVIVDPNGYLGRNSDGSCAVPHERLRAFAAAFPRMDLIFNLNVTTYKLGNGQRANGVSAWMGKFFPHPKELPELFHRPHGLIQLRKPLSGHQFVTLVLRSIETDDHARLRLYNINQGQGRCALEYLRDAGQIPLI